MKNLSRWLVVGVAALTVGCAWLGGAAPARADGSEKARARAERALRQGEFETAEKLYRELITKDTQDNEARLGLSYTLYKQRRLRDAYDAAARVLAVEPTSARAHALLGTTLLATGDFLLSVEEFRTALSFKPDEALAIAGVSMIHFYENRPSYALLGLKRALEIAPDEPDFVFNYAQAAARSERYREAADAYERFLRIAPRADADRRARIRGLIDFLRYIGAQGDLYEPGGAPRSVIPFELVNSRPIVTVFLNGNIKQPLRFVVDTGSGMCVVSLTAAQKLGLRAVARGGLARAVGGGGRFEIVYGFLTSLRVGEARITNIPIYLREFHNSQEPVDGYIGLSVLAKYLASVDYGRRELTLVRDDQPRVPPLPSALEQQTAAAPPPPAPPQLPAGVFELPIRATSSGFWSSAITVEGVEKPLNFIVDTGASISVVSEALTQREDLTRFVQPTKLKVYGAAGISDGVPQLVLPRVRLGDYQHPNLSAAVLDMEPINETSGFEQTGIIGGNILRFFRVTFDFQRAVVRLESLNSLPITPAAGDANVAAAATAGRARP
ncbi:MAG TPA: aspartyl protease family protein [Pyrinomonadaceae bacterium]|jgi:tetratricopeptide (TPR) repeat protein